MEVEELACRLSSHSALKIQLDIHAQEKIAVTQELTSCFLSRYGLANLNENDQLLCSFREKEKAASL